MKLEVQTDASIQAERDERNRAALLAELKARKLTGDAGDLTADLFGEGPTPLFNETRSTPEP